MVQLHQEPPAGAQHPADLGEHGPVLGVVEVPVGGEPAHHRAEGRPQAGRGACRPARSRPRRHGARRPGGPGRGTAAARRARRSRAPPAASRLAMRPAAAEVEDVAARAQPAETGHQARLGVVGDLGLAGTEEQQVVLVEQRLDGQSSTWTAAQPSSARRSGARRRTGPPGPRGWPAGRSATTGTRSRCTVQPVAEALEQGDLLVQPGTPLARQADQSSLVGVRSSGSDGRAPRISSRLRPTFWATRMNDTRRSTSQGGSGAARPRSGATRSAPRPRSSGARRGHPGPLAEGADAQPVLHAGHGTAAEPPLAFKFTRGGRLWHGV